MSVNLMSRQINRRQFAIGSAASLAAVSFLPSRSLVASAQSAADFASMGYPELAITVTATGFEGVPESTAAGRYLLKLTSSSPPVHQQLRRDRLHVGNVDRDERGRSDAVSGRRRRRYAPRDAGRRRQPRRRRAEPDAAPGGLPDALRRRRLRPTGQTAQAVIDLTPGEYVVWGDDPSAPQKPAIHEGDRRLPAGRQGPDQPTSPPP